MEEKNDVVTAAKARIEILAQERQKLITTANQLDAQRQATVDKIVRIEGAISEMSALIQPLVPTGAEK